MAKRLRFNNPTEIRRTLARVATMVINGELDVKRANSITATANVILRSIEISDQQNKLDELELILARASDAAKKK